MSTWEQRMAERTRKRHEADGPDSDYWTWPRSRELKYADASDDLIAELGDEEFNILVQDEARRLILVDYDPFEYRWSVEPPNDPHCDECQEPICRKCYRWGRYAKGQRHFGYTWRGVCGLRGCDCEHHKHEVWMASTTINPTLPARQPDDTWVQVA